MLVYVFSEPLRGKGEKYSDPKFWGAQTVLIFFLFFWPSSKISADLFLDGFRLKFLRPIRPKCAKIFSLGLWPQNSSQWGPVCIFVSDFSQRELACPADYTILVWLQFTISWNLFFTWMPKCSLLSKKAFFFSYRKLPIKNQTSNFLFSPVHLKPEDFQIPSFRSMSPRMNQMSDYDSNLVFQSY